MLRRLSSALVQQTSSLAPPIVESYLPKIWQATRRYSVKQQLPRLPVPSLEQTLDKYLKSVRPLLSDEEYDQTRHIVADFSKNPGPKLQDLLLKKAQSTDNWLAEWWLNVAYLSYRMPVVVHSNPGVICPMQDFDDEMEQLRFAAKWISGALSFKKMIDEQTLPEEKMGDHPLCMAQYYKILSSCRVPGVKRDSLVQFPAGTPNSPRHIMVIRNNHFFKLDVYGQNGKPLNVDQIHKQLMRIVDSSSHPTPPVGILTTESRKTWGSAYQRLVKNTMNKANVEEIQRSILVLCLDKPMPVTGPGMRQSQFVRQMFHGGGSHLNSGNRWFDKTMQLILSPDGACGMNYEHAAAEGATIAFLLDHAMSYAKKIPEELAPASGIVDPKKLEWDLSPETLEDIKEAEEDLDMMVDDVSLTALRFKGFGKDFAKSQKLSPDAFIQVAMQLAYHSIYDRPPATYESGSTRAFKLGRTDTIRSCTIDSTNFSKAMQDDSVSKQEKADLLRKAVDAHRKYTADVLSGQGIDRHLLAFKLLAIENGMNVPELFMDTAYSRSMHHQISSSNVTAKMETVFCFGPTVPDGYGVCYNPMAKQIIFAISAFNSCKETDSDMYGKSLARSLIDMHDLLLETTGSKL
ncbi:carnitine O-acetyltransferase [Lingula anatina]|uniref:Carnitine O-acetyltransferase n=1 Tax=Lingula anatina TaxID=7574 RepID=A0A1S3JZG5_LINAN|nr:carnitine O-acetyltransferase [Lingula anatina]|eukprot:XP_013415790.1 carnitine O-acetyltransferase [Lingula anatina]